MKKKKSRGGVSASLKKKLLGLSRKTIMWVLVFSLAIGGTTYVLLQRYSAATNSPSKSSYSALKVCKQNMKTGCLGYFQAKDKSKVNNSNTVNKISFLKKATPEEKKLYNEFKSQFTKLNNIAQKTKDIDQCVNVQTACHQDKRDFDALLTHKYSEKTLARTNIANSKAITKLGNNDKKKLADCRKKIKDDARKTKNFLNQKEDSTQLGFLAAFKETYFRKSATKKVTIRQQIAKIDPEVSQSDSVMNYTAKVVNKNDNVNFCIQEQIAVRDISDKLLKLRASIAANDREDALKAEAKIIKQRNATAVAMAAVLILATGGYAASAMAPAVSTVVPAQVLELAGPETVRLALPAATRAIVPAVIAL
jgi:hypothetical protein